MSVALLEAEPALRSTLVAGTLFVLEEKSQTNPLQPGAAHSAHSRQ